MITLYVKTNCRFSAEAVAVLDAYGVPYELKNVADGGVTEELIALGGKKQEPFLVDGETMMYESNAIVSYVGEKFGEKNGVKKVVPRVHVSKDSDVCAV